MMAGRSPCIDNLASAHGVPNRKDHTLRLDNRQLTTRGSPGGLPARRYTTSRMLRTIFSNWSLSRAK